MALWEKSVRLQQPLLDQMKALYGPKLPIEVRHYLSTWIESQTWSDVDPDNPAHESEARRLFDGMMHTFQNLRSTSVNNFILSTQLDALYTHMHNEYYNSVLELVRVVKSCLYAEAELVEKQEQLNTPSPLYRQVSTNVMQIQQQLQVLQRKTEAVDGIFRQLSSKLENFMIQAGECAKLDYDIKQGTFYSPEQLTTFRERKQIFDQILHKESEEMKKMCLELDSRFMNSLEQVKIIQQLMSQELASWKYSQRLFTWEDDRGRVELNQIQQWFGSLAELIWRIRQLSMQFDFLKSKIPPGIVPSSQTSNVQQLITSQLKDLIQESFVLEKQPPQVIKTANRFSATIRLLVGSKLQIHLSGPEVIVTIINDKQTRGVLSEPTKPIPPNLSTGDILNNQKPMDYNTQTGVHSCSFNFMQLRKIKRNSDRKSSETVTEEKFCLLFRTQFTIGGGEMEVSVMELSLPVVVTVHVTQQPHAEATIFWDNAFAETNRESFHTPDSVLWPRLSEALNCFFRANCGRGLTPQQLDHLGRKILGLGPDDDLSQRMVTRQQLLRDQLRSRSFTFWEWFYKHMDLIKGTLKREWEEGTIQGFMERGDVPKLLNSCPTGTFLIRFSEGEPGGISVAWVTDNCIDVLTERCVLNIAPWGKHDLGIRSLADRLHDLGHLLFLYPNKQKDEVFGKYYTPAPSHDGNMAQSQGYVVDQLKVEVVGHSCNTFASNPTSPNPSIVSMPVLTPGSLPPSLNGGALSNPYDIPSSFLDDEMMFNQQ